MKAGLPGYAAPVAEYFARPAPPLSPPRGVMPVSGAAGDAARGVRVAFSGWVSGGRIAELSYRVYGCPHTIAACALVAERLKDRPLASLAPPAPRELAAELAAPADKLGRLLVIEDALRAFIEAARRAPDVN